MIARGATIRKKEDHGKKQLPHTQGEKISTKIIGLKIYL